MIDTVTLCECPRVSTSVLGGVAPVLVCAGIEVDVVHTQRSQHAREVTNTRDFSAYDGICVVGGDGLFNEVGGYGMPLAKSRREMVEQLYIAVVEVAY